MPPANTRSDQCRCPLLVLLSLDTSLSPLRTTQSDTFGTHCPSTSTEQNSNPTFGTGGPRTKSKPPEILSWPVVSLVKALPP